MLLAAGIWPGLKTMDLMIVSHRTLWRKIYHVFFWTFFLLPNGVGTVVAIVQRLPWFPESVLCKRFLELAIGAAMLALLKALMVVHGRIEVPCGLLWLKVAWIAFNIFVTHLLYFKTTCMRPCAAPKHTGEDAC